MFPLSDNFFVHFLLSHATHVIDLEVAHVPKPSIQARNDLSHFP